MEWRAAGMEWIGRCRCGATPVCASRTEQVLCEADHSRCGVIEDLKEKVSAQQLELDGLRDVLGSLKELLDAVEMQDQASCRFCGGKFSHADSCVIKRIRTKHPQVM